MAATSPDGLGELRRALDAGEVTAEALVERSYARIDATAKTLKNHPAAMPDPIATSARNGDGIETLRAEIAALAADSPDALKSAPESAG